MNEIVRVKKHYKGEKRRRSRIKFFMYYVCFGCVCVCVRASVCVHQYISLAFFPIHSPRSIIRISIGIAEAMVDNVCVRVCEYASLDVCKSDAFECIC